MEQDEARISSGEGLEIVGATVAFVGIVGLFGIWVALIAAGLAVAWVGSQR